MFQLKKESSLVLYLLGFILVAWSLFQISLTDYFENNDNILIKIPSVYAQDDGGGNGNGKEVYYDNVDSDVKEPSLDKEDTQEKVVEQEDASEELTLSVDGQDESVDISRLVGDGLSGTDITSQLPFGDPQPLFVSLSPLPGGPFPPGGLPPTPGSPLPPGSPIPPEGGPTPPEDLSPLARDLPQLQGPSSQLQEKFPQPSNIEFKSYENKNLGVSFDIPVNWIQQQTPSPNEEIVFAEPNGKATLIIKVANASGVTIFEAASDFINGLKEGSSQTHNVYLNIINIQNFLSKSQESSKVITYTFGKDPTLPLLQGVTYITLNNNKAYIANFVTDVQNFESYNLIMQRILSSFEILSDVSIDND